MIFTIVSFVPFLVTCLTGIIIDYSLNCLPSKNAYPLLTAVVDNSGHGILALVTWFMVRWIQHGDRFGSLLLTELAQLSWYHQFLHPLSLCNILLCGLLSSALDLDHFLMASSFTLQGALSLPSRPFGHSVTFIVLVCSVLYSIRYLLLVYLHPTVVPLLPVTSSSSSSASSVATASSLVTLLPFLTGVLSYLGILLFVAWFTHQLRDSIRRGLWFYPLGSTSPLPYSLYLLLIGSLPYLIARTLHYTHPPSLLNNHLTGTDIIAANTDSNGTFIVTKMNEL